MLQVGSSVSVLLAGVLTSNGTLLTAGAHFDIIDETDKAWKVWAETESGKEITAWIPKKALVNPRDSGNFGNQPCVRCDFARWFRPTGWTQTFIQLATQS